MFVKLTEAEYRGQDAYGAGASIKVNINHILYYEEYQSANYGDRVLL